MRVMDELFTETPRRTPSFLYPSAQSPRLGSCVGAFFQMFDWNPSKRFFSVKRLPGERLEGIHVGRDRFLKEHTSSTSAKFLLINEENKDGFLVANSNINSSPESFKTDDTNARVPGVVARLMGLEYLPTTQCSSPSKSGCQDQRSRLSKSTQQKLGSPPTLLQELLHHESQRSKRSLKEKLPGFSKVLADSMPKREDDFPRRSPKQLGADNLARPTSKKAPSPHDEVKQSPNRSFLTRLQVGNSAILTSKSLNENSNSPGRSPSNARDIFLATVSPEARSKNPELNRHPSLRSRYSLEKTIQAKPERGMQQDSKSGSGGMSRSKKKAPISSSSRGARLPNSATRKSLRSDEQSKMKIEVALATSSKLESPLRSHLSNPPIRKKGTGPSCTVQGTPEASVRVLNFGTKRVQAAPSLRNVEGLPIVSNVKKQVTSPSSPQPHVGKQETLAVEDSSHVNCEGHLNMTVSTRDCLTVPSKAHMITDVNAAIMDVGSPILITKNDSLVDGKQLSLGGLRSMRLRSGSGKQDSKDNRIFPSEKPIHSQEELPTLKMPPKSTTKGASTGLLTLFTTRKQHTEKKKGNYLGEALVLKRSESNLIRSLRRRPPPPNTEPCTKVKVKISSQGNCGPNVWKQSQVDNCMPALAKVEVGEDVFISKTESEQCPPSIVKQNEGKDLGALQSRYRSIDDVFPELPLEESDFGPTSPDLGGVVQSIEDQFSGFGLQGETASFDCQSVERMFGKGIGALGSMMMSPDLLAPPEHRAPGTSPVSPEVFVTECGALETSFPNSPLVNYEKMFFASRGHTNLQNLFEVVSLDHRPHSSGENVRLPMTRLQLLSPCDDENVDADEDMCTNNTVADVVGTSNPLEMQENVTSSKDVFTPKCVKKITKKALAMGSKEVCTLGVDVCGQPSQVSILKSPFLDDPSSAPNASLIGDLAMATEADKIKQAILEISRFRNFDVTSIGLEEPSSNLYASVSPREEENYIREVLNGANLLFEGKDSLQKWHALGVPINPSLFDRLEFGSIQLDECTLMESKRWGDIPDPQRQGLNIRSERRLLFDCINEIVALEPWTRNSFLVGLPMYPKMHVNSIMFSRVSGEKLVKEIYSMICHWRDVAGNAVDDLIDIDMSIPRGKWLDFSQEVTKMGLDIACTLLKDMIEEAVIELSSISRT